MKVIIFIFVIIGSALAAKLGHQNTDELGIVNGIEAVPHSIPYQAAIIVKVGERTRSCSGSLISERFVVTAAQCIDGATSAQVFLGVHDLTTFQEGTVEVNSKNLIIHEHYDDGLIVNDIGLIELDGEVFPSETIDYAPLPSSNQILPSLVGLSGRVSGWGRTDGTSNTPSDVLLQINNTVVPNSQCDSDFHLTRDNEICLSSEEGRTACLGDKGGPLVVGHTQVGIVSFLNPKCLPDSPTVFVKLESYLDWLQTHSDWQG